MATFLRRSHLWLGLVTAVLVVVVCLTGIALNHVERLRLWNPPEGQEGIDPGAALPVNDLLIAAIHGARSEGLAVEGPGEINRVMYRPERGYLTVRFTDPRVTEVVVEVETGRVLQVAPRGDQTVEHLHSGEMLGQRGVVVTDVVAVVLILLVIGGVALWLRRLRREWGNPPQELRTSTWVRFNRRFHLVGGLVVAITTVALSITGILLNHKRELGLMVEPVRLVESEAVAQGEPASLARIIDWGLEHHPGGQAQFSDVQWVDYRPLSGYAKVRFQDGRDTEVIVDVYDGTAYSAAARRDRFVEDLHSGAVFGQRAVLISDVTGVFLILLTVNGLYLWVWPAWQTRTRAGAHVREATEPEAVRDAPSDE